MFTSLLNPTTLLKKLPSQCAVCRSWQDDRICQACVSRFAPAGQRCTQCAIRVPTGVTLCGACLRHPPPYAHTVAAADHAFPWNRLVTALKFDSELDLAEPLAQRMLVTLRRSEKARPQAELIVPTPLSPSRLAERGYNQAWELARRLARALQVPARADLLLRLRDTGHQLGLTLEQRQSNLRGAFAGEPRELGALQGKNIALIDDVMTTGATAGELSHVLLQAGAAAVQVWVVTRTPLD